MSYSLLNRSSVTARKAHTCIWCWLAILPGSRYVREASTYDGHFQNFAWHEACRKDADDHFDDVGEGEFTSGENDMPFFALYQLERNTIEPTGGEMFNPIFGTINGFRIIESEHMVVYAGEDWSKVRSPGRARRRRKKHRQNITALYEPDGKYLVDQARGVIYCHPAMARKLVAAAVSAGGDHG